VAAPSSAGGALVWQFVPVACLSTRYFGACRQNVKGGFCAHSYPRHLYTSSRTLAGTRSLRVGVWHLLHVFGQSLAKVSHSMDIDMIPLALVRKRRSRMETMLAWLTSTPLHPKISYMCSPAELLLCRTTTAMLLGGTLRIGFNRLSSSFYVMDVNHLNYHWTDSNSCLTGILCSDHRPSQEGRTVIRSRWQEQGHRNRHFRQAWRRCTGCKGP
jgi:hypothetical protein